MMEREFIYLDYNATTPLDNNVYDAICSSLKHEWGNPSSDSHYGKKAQQQINYSRNSVAEMLGAQSESIIFTSGGTESNNMVIYSALEHYKEFIDNDGKPHIVTSSVEHDATLKLVEHLEGKSLIELSKISLFSIEKLARSIKENTCLLTLMMANNETGVILPIQEIGSYLKSLNQRREKESLPKIYFHIDAAQAIGKFKVNFGELMVDYITVVGHKFYGPRIGALCKSPSAPLLPLLFGGGQERSFRPGTENTGMIVGLGKACEIVSKKLNSFITSMTELRNHLEYRLEEEFGDCVKINFASALLRLPNTASVQFVNVSGKELLLACPKVIASIGAACHSSSVSRVLLEEIGEEAARQSVRFSVGRETTKEDIERAVTLLHQAYQNLIKSK